MTPTSEERKHTELPWKASYNGTVCIGVQNGDFYGQMICNTILPETDAEYEKEKQEIEANVNLIVTAVNSYYSLKEQNQRLKEALKEAVLHVDSHFYPELKAQCDSLLEESKPL